MPNNQWMDQENVVYMCNKVLLSSQENGWHWISSHWVKKANLKKANITCSCLSAEYKSKMMMMMIVIVEHKWKEKEEGTEVKRTEVYYIYIYMYTHTYINTYEDSVMKPTKPCLQRGGTRRQGSRNRVERVILFKYTVSIYGIFTLKSPLLLIMLIF
jgi:hypothetical protein